MDRIFRDDILRAALNALMMDRVYGELHPSDRVDEAVPFRRIPLTEAKPYENCVPAPDIFVAQVIGESMNRRIPNDFWCVWRLNPAGTRQGKVVLAHYRDVRDPEHGGQYTVKIYENEKEATEGPGGGWRNLQIILKPDSTDPSFQPIVLEDLKEGEPKIVAELVEVLG